MNRQELTAGECQRRQQLDNLNAVEKALRANLHLHGLDATARAHMQRALHHTLEAHVATNEVGHARSVQQLLDHLEKAERLAERLQRRTSTEAITRSIRI